MSTATAGSAASAAAGSAAIAGAPAPAAAAPAGSSGGGVFQLTPLYGCESAHSGARCSVLRLDDFTILLDLGWDERYSEAELSALRAVIPSVDLVLLTHPDLLHLGALPYAVGKLGLTAPIYATLPVWRMGQMFMYAAWQERWGHLAPGDVQDDPAEAPMFSLDDVDRAFDQMRQLKFSQTVRLADKGEGIEVTPSCAGHLLGGAFWHIAKGSESIIYAVDFNHASERHLSGALLAAPQLHRPSVLITDATNALHHSAPKRSQQDQALCTAVLERMRQGGSVLMPVDAAGRVLELLLVLHGFWSAQGLASSYTLAFLSPQSRNTVEFARSQLEWMTDKVRKLFDTTKSNPFALPHLRLLSSAEELDSLPRPFCLLASNYALETSLAQEALLRGGFSEDSRNLLLLTSRAGEWSVVGQLFDSEAPNALRRVLPAALRLQRRQRVPLEGEELAQHRAKLEREREQRRMEAASKAEEDEEEEEGDDFDDGDVMMAPAGAAAAGIGAKGLKGLLDPRAAAALLRHKGAAALQPRFPLFPYAEPKRTFDVFGETISAEELRAITGQGQGQGQAPLQMGAGALFAGINSTANGSNTATRNGAVAPHPSVDAPGVTDGSMSDIPGGSSESDPTTVPHKLVVRTIDVPLLCSVLYLDLEGRSDGRSLRTTIKDLSPRKLVLLSGSAAAKASLRAHCLSSQLCAEVLAPASRESVSVSSETALYRVALRDSFLQSLNFVTVRTAGRGALDGLAEEEGTVQVAYAQGAVAMHFDKGASLPVLTAAPLEHASQGSAHAALFLGHLQPLELAQALVAGGVTVELVGGVCVCSGGMVNVRKVSPTSIRIQGALCEEYFRIRDILYEQYEIV